MTEPSQRPGTDAGPVLWTAVILGQPYSKANSRKLVAVRQAGQPMRPMFIKSEEARAYEQHALAQLAKLRPPRPIAGDLSFVCMVWYESRRPDLDTSLIEDVLQKAGIIENDRQLREKHLYWRLDPRQPRALIELHSLGR